MMSTTKAARASSQSIFCLCPTGDSKGFTGRFWFALAHGCVPVRYDGWARHLSFDDVAWPSRHRVDWRKAVVNVQRGEEVGLMERLQSELASGEAEGRLRYVRSISPWLGYRGGPNGTRPTDGGLDAADVLIEQLEARFLKTKSQPTLIETGRLRA